MRLAALLFLVAFAACAADTPAKPEQATPEETQLAIVPVPVLQQAVQLIERQQKEIEQLKARSGCT